MGLTAASVVVASPRSPGRTPLRGRVPTTLSSVGEEVVLGRVLVRAQRPIPRPIAQSLADAGAVVSGRIGDVEILDIPTYVPPDLIADAISLIDEVDYCEPDPVLHADVVVTDPSAGNQWHLSKIGAPAAWDVSTGDASIKIAVLDTGCDGAHPDLAGKLLQGYNFVDNNIDTSDLHGHGTHVAGIAGAATDNRIGVAGVGYRCSILPVRVLDDTGAGTYSDLIRGIDYAVNQGAKIINMSLGGNTASRSLEAAVDAAAAQGALVIAAAGNSGNTRPFYPAYCESAIAVGASTSSDQRASFSNYGPWVDVAAPGTSILSTFPINPVTLGSSATGYDTLSGTSMATPIVSGIAGLLFAHLGPNARGAQVRSLIESTADPMARDWTANGRVNAAAALGRATLPTIPVAGTVRNISVGAGQWKAGDLSSISAADARFFQVQAAFDGLGRERATEVEVDVDGLDGTLLELDLTIRLKSSPATVLAVSALDWRANQYVPIATSRAGVRSTDTSIHVIQSIASYIQGGMVRLHIRNSAPVAFRTQIDSVSASGTATR